MANATKFKDMNPGTVISYSNPTIAQFETFIILNHFEDHLGIWTNVVRLDNYETELFEGHHTFIHGWEIVKAN
jgi:hypothetical protein